MIMVIKQTFDAVKCKTLFNEIVLLLSIKKFHDVLQRINHNHITVTRNIFLNSNQANVI